MTDPKPPTRFTRRSNADAAAALVLDDADFQRAERGLLARHPTGRILEEGRVVWDVADHDFTRGEVDPPDSVHPSLWRQARLNSLHGIFEIAEGVWQARGYDLSNITFVAGERGWIVIDPLTTAATAAACLELADDTLGSRPVTAVIYTHSHVDHFGGAHGVISEDDVTAGRVRVIAPDGFLDAVISENVIAGTAMGRRAGYMYGPLLDPGPRGQVDCGLGKITPRGASGLIAPTETVDETGTELVVDGVRMVFQNTPGGEAPAEMNFHFPDLRLLCMAENCSHNLHNLYTLRGAKVRDALSWSKYINEAIELFAADTEILFASHHWPRFGADDARRFLEKQRDVYRWLHDQTMRLANKGWTASEIAEHLRLPECFATESHTREYYGTVSHNAKAVYQHYLGWFDANPANLDPHPPRESGIRYVAAMGGPDAVLEKARVAFDEGDYRWVAQLVNHVVFADPDNSAARELQADALEQLGYQSESGPWRNFYLTGARELRGAPPGRAGRARGMSDALTVEHLFDAIGVRLDAEKVVGARVIVNWRFTDIGEDHLLGLENCALHHVAGRHAPDAEATLTLSKRLLGLILTRQTTVTEALETGGLQIEGDAAALLTLFEAVDEPEPNFAIIEPRSTSGPP